MARITPDEVAQIADLARLTLTDQEKTRLSGEMEKILEYVATLEGLAHSEVESADPDPVTPLRPDEPQPSLTNQQALANAPQTVGGFFVVPRILERE